MPIYFFSEEIDFSLKSPDQTTSWLEEVITSNKKLVGDINYIFCSDEYLLQINRDHLNHDYYTDIITFDNSEEEGTIESDIFISVDRVNENANNLETSFETELARVMVHGILHLVGYEDKTEEGKKAMREKENACLSLQKK